MRHEQSTSTLQMFRARWVLPVDRPPIHDGIVVISEGRIVEVARALPGSSLECLNVALLPAFVNAHTHLEFSDLDSPLGEPGMPFPTWIRGVTAWRRDRESQPNAAAVVKKAIARGISDSTVYGVAYLGEIATSTTSIKELGRDQKPSTIFWEQIALTDERIEPMLQTSLSMLDLVPRTSKSLRGGLSPHAPYTVHPQLLQKSVQLARDRRLPLAMHLAESKEEIELLSAGKGLFRELLEALNVWPADVFIGGLQPLSYLQRLSAAPRTLVIHGNYLSPEELGYLGTHRDRMSLVYCPRTHRYFRHDPYPLAAAVARGVRVALGTDSRASSPDLDMLAELRCAANQHPDVSPERLVQMATLHAAEAVGVESEFGSLTPGKKSAIVAVPLREDLSRDPYGWLFSQTLQNFISRP